MTRFTLLALALALAAALAPAAMSAQTASPVVKVSAPKFGPIIATRGHLALYTWNREKDGKVRCTGACAKLWPPLVVAKGTRVARHVAGVMGTFGTVVRPDGRTQVTLHGRPLYTFSKDTPTKILCKVEDGWFVVKA